MVWGGQTPSLLDINTEFVQYDIPDTTLRGETDTGVTDRGGTDTRGDRHKRGQTQRGTNTSGGRTHEVGGTDMK